MQDNSHQVQLQAGSLSVSVMTTGEQDLQTAVQAAHTEMSWLMDAWTEVEGEMVRTVPEGFQMGD